MNQKPTWDQGKHFAQKTAQWLVQNLLIFAPQNVGNKDKDLSDLHSKITPHSVILAKVHCAAFFGLKD